MAKTILIVDDSPSVLAILEDMLDGLSTFLRKPVKEVQLKTILKVVLGS